MSAMKNLLETEPKARERANKNHAIAWLIADKYGSSYLQKGRIADIVGDVLNLDRAWRKVTEENEHLRGEDYDSKKKLEQKAQMDIGYEQGFNKDTKTIASLFDDE